MNRYVYRLTIFFFNGVYFELSFLNELNSSYHIEQISMLKIYKDIVIREGSYQAVGTIFASKLCSISTVQNIHTIFFTSVGCPAVGQTPRLFPSTLLYIWLFRTMSTPHISPCRHAIYASFDVVGDILEFDFTVQYIIPNESYNH